MRPIFVTGAQGFLGRNFTACALVKGERVVGFGRSARNDEFFTHAISIRGRSVLARVPADLRSALESSSYEYHQGDLIDSSTVASIIRDSRPRAVVHLASALRADDFQRLVRTNIEGTMALFDAIAKAGVPIDRIVMGSSAAVYGRASRMPVAEDDRCEPCDLYATSKFAAERIAAIRSQEMQACVSYARIFSLVGPGQDERHVCGRFAEQAADMVANNRRTLRVGDLSPTRDFIDVRDASTALTAILRANSEGGAYNVCNAIETSIQSVLTKTLRSAGVSGHVQIEQSYQRACEVPRQVGNNTRLRRLGWSPSFTLDRSIDDLAAYYRSLK